MNVNKMVRKISVGFVTGGFAFLCMVFGRMLERGLKDTMMIITIFTAIMIFGILLQVVIGLDTVESLKNN